MAEYILFETCLGWVGLAADSTGLSAVTLPQESQEKAWQRIQENSAGQLTYSSSQRHLAYRDALIDYFKGKEKILDLPVNWAVFSPFQKKVLQAVKEIPYGQTRSYQWVAGAIGQPAASRAVGNALGANKIPLVIPCHRVIRKDGSVGGFTGADIAVKKQLIELEKKAGKFY